MKRPRHNELDGQTITYGGKTYKLSSTAPLSCTMQIPIPQVELNPTMSFVPDGKGGMSLKIKPNPTARMPVGFDPKLKF